MYSSNLPPHPISYLPLPLILAFFVILCDGTPNSLASEAPLSHLQLKHQEIRRSTSQIHRQQRLHTIITRQTGMQSRVQISDRHLHLILSSSHAVSHPTRHISHLHLPLSLTPAFVPIPYRAHIVVEASLSHLGTPHVLILKCIFLIFNYSSKKSVAPRLEFIVNTACIPSRMHAVTATII